MKDKRSPRNTTQDVKNNPLITLAIAMREGASGMIESQEAAGQSGFVNSTTLPTKIMTENGKEILEKFGIIFGEVVEDDPMFQHVELPEGWTREGTGHNMHSNVLDERGRKRIGVFYKAAFYDRSAHLWVNGRYSSTYDYERSEKDKVYVGIVTDCDNTIWEADPMPGIKEDGEENWDAYRECQVVAKAWLNEHYPDWNDPAAYWE